MVSGMTRIYGIIGDPVTHSLSPLMHNTAFKAMGLNCIYIPFQVKKTELKAAIEGIRALNIHGLNVTMPHKLTIIPLIDRLDPLAERIGAVNTVINNEGTLTGYNTDAHGFIRALLDNGINPQGKKVVVFGAGGVSRAICFALAEKDCVISIVNRTIDRARKLAKLISIASRHDVKSFGMFRENQCEALDKADIVVNATNVGMGETIGESMVIAGLLSSSMVVFDTIYHPIETQLLRDAKKIGAQVIDGLDMLLWQGVISFGKWTGLDAPFELMKNELTGVLRFYED
jgi:shikimate dehydrogenase